MKADRSEEQEEKDENMRCWDCRENHSLALTWWKVSWGPWAGPAFVQMLRVKCKSLIRAADT